MPENKECGNKIISEEYGDFIVSKQGKRLDFEIPEEEKCIQDAGAGYEVVYVDRQKVGPLNLERFTYNSIPNCYGLLDMENLNKAGITQVQNYPGLQLMGEKIMIGFIDTGIEYQNAIFRNLDGTTRIAGMWDQTEQGGTAPEGFSYGSVYEREEINEALSQITPEEKIPETDDIGHGTYLASVAAGGADVAQRFLGAAPEATLGVVKLKQAKQYLRDYYFIPENVPCYQENDIMLGIRYLWELAIREQMPLVVCVAVGGNLGGHNGTSPLSQALETYANINNRGIVIGTGNEANQRHHYMGRVEEMNGKEQIEMKIGKGVKGVVAELWTDIPNLFTIAIVSPSGERVPPIPIKQSSNMVFRFVFERTEVTVDYKILVEGNNSQLIHLRFRDPAEGIWKIIVEPVRIIDGIFHVWLPTKEFISGEAIFLKSNPDTTITSPSSVYSAITVAYYNAPENSVDINSGRGYTRNGRIKPDFAAPGVEVLGALPGGRFGRRSGSSAATAITAGATALLLEWIIYDTPSVGADSLQLKNLFILGTDQQIGVDYPNKEWGFGTLNVYQTLDILRQI